MSPLPNEHIYLIIITKPCGDHVASAAAAAAEAAAAQRVGREQGLKAFVNLHTSSKATLDGNDPYAPLVVSLGSPGHWGLTCRGVRDGDCTMFNALPDAPVSGDLTRRQGP